MRQVDRFVNLSHRRDTFGAGWNGLSVHPRYGTLWVHSRQKSCVYTHHDVPF